MSKQGLLYTAAWLAIVIPMFVNGIEYIFIHNADYDEYHKVFPHWYYGKCKCLAPAQQYVNSHLIVFQISLVVIPSLYSYPPTTPHEVLFACIFPLQGFLNALVYFRPKVVGIQREHPDLSSVQAVLRALNIANNMDL